MTLLFEFQFAREGQTVLFDMIEYQRHKFAEHFLPTRPQHELGENKSTNSPKAGMTKR